jgi:hypothetical protein
MQRCIKCKRTYLDDKQKFCTYDGGKLVPADDAVDQSGVQNNAGDPNRTVMDHQPPPVPFDPYKTVAAVPTAHTADFYPHPTGPMNSQYSEEQGTIAGPPPQRTQSPMVEPPSGNLPSANISQGTQQFTAPVQQPPQPINAPQPSQQWQQPPQPVPAPPVPPEQWQPPSQPLPTQQWQTPSQPLPVPEAVQPPPPSNQFEPVQAAPQQTPSYAESQPQIIPPQAPKKSSKVPLILGLVALVLILGIGGIAAAFFLVVRPRLAQREKLTGGETTPPVTVSADPGRLGSALANPEVNPSTEPDVSASTPSGETKFENSLASLDQSLAEHYVDFSFYYPNSWTLKAAPNGSSNFVEVDRKSPQGPYLEHLNVSWYKSKGTIAQDLPGLPAAVESMSSKFAKQIQGYQKISEGRTQINSIDGYEFRFAGGGETKGDIKIWGRVVFLPPGVDGEEHGVTLIMLATSLAPDITSANDVGTSGQLPSVLKTFRLEH